MNQVTDCQICAELENGGRCETVGISFQGATAHHPTSNYLILFKMK